MRNRVKLPGARNYQNYFPENLEKAVQEVKDGKLSLRRASEK